MRSNSTTHRAIAMAACLFSLALAGCPGPFSGLCGDYGPSGDLKVTVRGPGGYPFPHVAISVHRPEDLDDPAARRLRGDFVRALSCMPPPRSDARRVLDGDGIAELNLVTGLYEVEVEGAVPPVVATVAVKLNRTVEAVLNVQALDFAMAGEAQLRDASDVDDCPAMLGQLTVRVEDAEGQGDRLGHMVEVAPTARTLELTKKYFRSRCKGEAEIPAPMRTRENDDLRFYNLALGEYTVHVKDTSPPLETRVMLNPYEPTKVVLQLPASQPPDQTATSAVEAP